MKKTGGKLSVAKARAVSEERANKNGDFFEVELRKKEVQKWVRETRFVLLEKRVPEKMFSPSIVKCSDPGHLLGNIFYLVDQFHKDFPNGWANIKILLLSGEVVSAGSLKGIRAGYRIAFI